MAASTLSRISGLEVARGVDCVVVNENEGSLVAVSSPGREINVFHRVEDESGVESFEKRAGHVLPVPSDCLEFGEGNQTLAAGTMSGSLVLLDLEKGIPITCTPEGRRTNIIKLCQDPDQSRVWASASLDSTIRLFDTRQRNTIASYQLDVKRINAFRYSPNGEFLAIGTEDCQVKVVNAMDGKQYAGFVGHSAPVCDIRFHPSEYLIASASKDKTVRFWDLESFECVTQSQPLPGPVSRIFFEPEGASLFASTPAGLRALGWEPARVFCHLTPDNDADWVGPMVLGLRPIEDRLIALTLSPDKTKLSLYGVDLESLRPFFTSPDDSPTVEALGIVEEDIPYEEELPPPAATGASASNLVVSTEKTVETTPKLRTPAGTPSMSRSRARRSFTRQSVHEKELPAKAAAGIDAHELTAFRPRDRIDRSPPPPSPRTPEPSAPLPGGNSGTIYVQLPSPPQTGGAFVVRDVVKNPPPPITGARPGRKPSSPNLPRKNSNGAKNGTTSNNNKGRRIPAIATVSPQPAANRRPAAASLNPITVAPFGKQKEIPLLPGTNPDALVDLGATFEVPKEHSIFNRLPPEDFLPAHLSTSLSFNSGPLLQNPLHFDGDCFAALQKDSTLIRAVLEHRLKSLQTLQRVWARDGTRRAVEVAVSSTDPAILVELLRLLNQKSNLWSLEYCALLLPQIRDLVIGSESVRPSYVETAVGSLRLILNIFGTVIRNGLYRAPAIGTDVEGDARMAKCRSCVAELLALRNGLTDRLKLGDVSKLDERTHRYFREINVLLQILDA